MGQAFGCIQVVQSTVAVKEKCGQFDRLLKPGCHCLPWCLCHRVAGKVSFRVQQLDVRCEAKTKDNAFVTVVASIQYSVMEGKANDAFYKLSDAKGQIQAKGLIQANVFNVIRVSVSKMNWDSAFEEKDAIAKEVEAISECGIKIVKTLIMDIEPHSNVKKAMNEKNAEAIKSAAENNAEEEEILKIKRAEAKAEVEKILQIKRAEGEAEAEKILLIKRAEAKAEAEKISQIKRAEGEAEAEKILLIKRAEGKAEAEKILQINRAEGQAESKSHRPSDCGRTEGQPACFL